MAKMHWKYDIGDRVVDYREDGSIKRDLIIIDKRTVAIQHKAKKSAKGYYIQNQKYYRYHCNVCGWEDGWMVEYSLCGKEKCGCSCCNSRTVVRGINDIATTHPNLEVYFKNKDDAYTHSAHSDFKPKLICPHCGYEKENSSVCNLVTNGFICPVCSDGISYGEKFIISLLKQLEVDFLPQLSKNTYSWCQKYRYDFWFKFKKEEYIIEVHGRQHYYNNTMISQTLESIQTNDTNKKELAFLNGFDDKHYIVLNCEKSSPDWIKNSIYRSILKQLFDLSLIKWEKCHIDALRPLTPSVVQYWKEHQQDGITTTQLAKLFGLNITTIQKYLRIGNDLGWCKYSANDEWLKNLELAKQARRKKVVILDKEMKLLATLDSLKEAVHFSTEVLKEDTPFIYQAISRVCIQQGKSPYRGKYYLMFLDDYIKNKK